MKDFTKKGTKLPVIPVGTEYLTGLTERKWESHYCKKPLYSHGETLRRGEVYIKAEKKNYNENDDFYLIKLSTIERLAKEQGMCDGCIDFEFIKDWWHMLPSSKNQELRQIYFKNHIGFLGIDRLFFIYKSEINNENTKVKLQENGTVTVTDTETTTTLSKVTVDEICRLVKEEKPKLEVGKWYHYIGGLYVWNNGNQTYGFNSQKRFDDHYSFSTSDGAVEASPETVEQYLKNEFIRLGGKVGAKVECLALKESIEIITSMDFYFEQSGNCLWVKTNTKSSDKGACIFDNGKFATIIQPETITRAEAEKQLGKVITD